MALNLLVLPTLALRYGHFEPDFGIQTDSHCPNRTVCPRGTPFDCVKLEDCSTMRSDMSALGSIADIRAAMGLVRFVPQTDRQGATHAFRRSPEACEEPGFSAFS
jgi:hypothetical protein